MNESITKQYSNLLIQALSQIDETLIKDFIEQLLSLRDKKGTLYICGNGGSAANAMHMANDFIFGAEPNGNSLNTEALSANGSVMTCLGNDIGYENIFSHQLKVKAQPHDMLVVLSGSGNSKNILNALEQANSIRMKSVAIVGFDGGKAKSIANTVFHTNINDMQIAEDMQLIIGHIIMKSLFVTLSNKKGSTNG